MRDAIIALRAAGRPELADLIAEHGRAAASDYAARLHDHRPGGALEPVLWSALEQQLQGLGFRESERAAIQADLDRRRVVQTATHLTASEGPTFLAVHAVATSGLPPAAPYLVGAFSGVPFSNPAWSGCLNFSARHDLAAVLVEGTRVHAEAARAQADRERDGVGFDRRVSLVTARARDGLVYGAPVTERLRQVTAALAPAVADLAPAPREDFGSWALAFCQATARRVLACDRIGYLDLNAWVAAYLAQVVADPGHPMSRLLFDQALRSRLAVELGQAPTWFYAGVQRSKRARVVSLSVSDERLVGPGFELDHTPEVVGQALRAGRLCPAVLPCFAALAVVNRVRCAGSFEQVEYLPRIVRALAAAGFEPARELEPDAVAWLTTGRALGPDGRPVYPLDVILGTAFEPDTGATLWDWLAPLMPRLLGKA